MSLDIHQDLNRFRRIVKGQIRKDLGRYMSSGEIIGKQGDKLVSIPLPQIDIPHLRYGKNGGVGQGEGDEGEKVDGEGEGQKAGDGAGEHMLEAEITLDELAQIIGEELELPRIQPKGKKNVTSVRDVYNGIARVGPNALRHQKRTYREALKREIAGGGYDPRHPVLIPRKEDMRYRTWNAKTEPQSAAAIVYIMDVSGSMGREQKEIVRLEAFWIDTWLRANYKHIESRFIVHDATAREVDRDTFFRTKESGGTLISSAFLLADQLITEHYPPDEWNTYIFQFSDGDNWSATDTRTCLDLLKTRLLTRANLYCYGQVESEYGSGQFYKDLVEVESDERVVLSKIADRDGIMASIKQFLGKGR